MVAPLPAAGATATVAYRREVALWRMDLTPSMTRVLAALLNGEPIAAVLTSIGAAASVAAEEDVTTWFRDWAGGGLFVAVSCD